MTCNDVMSNTALVSTLTCVKQEMHGTVASRNLCAWHRIQYSTVTLVLACHNVVLHRLDKYWNKKLTSFLWFMKVILHLATLFTVRSSAPLPKFVLNKLLFLSTNSSSPSARTSYSSTCAGEEKCIQIIGGEIWGKETTWKTQALMAG